MRADGFARSPVWDAAGCWPLEARVVIDEETVTWNSFRQPFRPQRDYSDFGPFTFDRREYEAAIAELATRRPP
jgi:hypothetical protein